MFFLFLFCLFSNPYVCVCGRGASRHTFSQPLGLSGLSSQAAQPLLLLLHQTPESHKHTNTQSAGDQLEELAGSTVNLLELLLENSNLLRFKDDSWSWTTPTGRVTTELANVTAQPRRTGWINSFCALIQLAGVVWQKENETARKKDSRLSWVTGSFLERHIAQAECRLFPLCFCEISTTLTLTSKQCTWINRTTCKKKKIQVSDSFIYSRSHLLNELSRFDLIKSGENCLIVTISQEWVVILISSSSCSFSSWSGAFPLYSLNRWDFFVKFPGPRRNFETFKPTSTRSCQSVSRKKKVNMIFGRLWKASEQLLYWPVVHCNQCLYQKHKLISSWTCLSWYISKLLFHKRIQTCNYWFFCYNDDTSAPPSKRLQSLSFCVLRWISVSVSCMMLDSCCALGLWW